MRKIIQYYSLFITLFLFSSVPSYAERAPRRSRRKRSSTKKQNVTSRRNASSQKDFTVFQTVMLVMGGGVLVYIGYSMKSPLSNPKKIFTEKEKELISDALSGKKDKIDFEDINELLKSALEHRKEEIVKLLIRKKGAKIIDKALSWACFPSSVGGMEWLLDVCKIDIESEGKDQRTPFLYAVIRGRLGIAQELSRRGAKVGAVDKWQDNALHFACLYSDRKEMVTWLLDKTKEGCNIGLESEGRNQRTPFICAAERGHFGVAALLKEKGANMKAKDEYGNNALHLACTFSGSKAMVTWLLDICEIDLKSKGRYNKTPFLLAAEKGDLGIAALLKERGAHIKEKDEYGNNALHLACTFSGSKAMVTWLLDICGIDLKTKGRYQRKPFLWAAERGHVGVAEELRKRGADVHAKDENGNNALHLACTTSGSKVMVTWLLDTCKIKIETKGVSQLTPFLCAAGGGHLDIAKELRERGADVHAKSGIGDNALHYACRDSESKAMVTWLLDVCKISIEAEGVNRKTPFLCAASGGRLGIAKQLGERGANIHAKDMFQDNALHYACRDSESKEMVTWLLDVCKISIESKGFEQKTPFLWAAQRGHLKIAKELEERGANIHAKDESGNNALMLANMNNKDNKNEAMIKYLKQLKLT